MNYIFTSSNTIDTVYGPKFTFKNHVNKKIWGCINCDSKKCSHAYRNAFMINDTVGNLYVCKKCFDHLENIKGWEKI
jgi:hypothetical protein